MFLGESGGQAMREFTAIARPSMALNSREFSSVSPAPHSSQAALQFASSTLGAFHDRMPKIRAHLFASEHRVSRPNILSCPCVFSAAVFAFSLNHLHAS